MRFADDVQIFGLMRPLIEQGRILPITPSTDVCLHCLAKEAMGPRRSRRFDASHRAFSTWFYSESQFSLEQDEYKTVLVISPPPELEEHTFYQNLGRNLPTPITKRPRLLQQLASGQRVIVSKRLARELQLGKKEADTLFTNIGFELVASQTLNSSLLTNNPLDVEILQELSGDKITQSRNKLIMDLLTCVVPFLNEFTPTELLKMRNAEEDSFIIFRSALAKAADEYTGRVDSFNPADAKALYLDVIEPELAKLTLKVKSARRSMIKSARRSILGWTAAISFGIYYGILPSSIRQLAEFLGLTKIGADIATKMMDQSDGEELIKPESMYFLWKVKQAASR
jgi:hypothetical protein